MIQRYHAELGNVVRILIASTLPFICGCVMNPGPTDLTAHPYHLMGLRKAQLFELREDVFLSIRRERLTPQSLTRFPFTVKQYREDPGIVRDGRGHIMGIVDKGTRIRFTKITGHGTDWVAGFVVNYHGIIESGPFRSSEPIRITRLLFEESYVEQGVIDRYLKPIADPEGSMSGGWQDEWDVIRPVSRRRVIINGSVIHVKDLAAQLTHRKAYVVRLLVICRPIDLVIAELKRAGIKKITVGLPPLPLGKGRNPTLLPVPDTLTQATGVAFSPDGTFLAASGEDGIVRLWDVSTKRQTTTLRGHSDAVLAVAVSPDGTCIASASRDMTARLWDVAEATELQILKGHTHFVQTVAFSPDGRILATGGCDTTVKLWDVDSARELGTLSGHSGTVTSADFSPDGGVLATGSVDGTIRLWDVAQQRELAVPTLREKFESVKHIVKSVSFHPEGRFLASGGDGGPSKAVKLWDVLIRQKYYMWHQGWGPVSSVAFSPDGTRLASAGRGGSITISDYFGTRPNEFFVTDVINVYGHVTSIAFSPDGRKLAVAGFRTFGSNRSPVSLWDLPE